MLDDARTAITHVVTIERFNRIKVAHEDVEIVIDVLDPSVSVIDGRIKVTADQISALPLLSDVRGTFLELAAPGGPAAIAHLRDKLEEVIGTHPDSRAFTDADTHRWTEQESAEGAGGMPDPRRIVGGFFAPGEDGWTRVLIDASGNLSSKLHRPAVIDPASITGIAFSDPSDRAADMPAGLVTTVQAV